MKIRKAEISDIDKLIKLRIDYLRMDNGKLSNEQELAVTNQLKYYLPKHISKGDFIALIGEENGQIISSAFLILFEKPANLAFITGKTGTVMNVLTYPEYRRHGYAFQLLTALIEEANQHGLSQLDLMATGDGKPLYEKLGFTMSQYTAMKLRLDNSWGK